MDHRHKKFGFAQWFTLFAVGMTWIWFRSDWEEVRI